MKLLAVAIIVGVVSLAIGGIAGWRLTDKSATVSELRATNSHLRHEVTAVQHQAATESTQLRGTRRLLAQARADQIQPRCPTPEYYADGGAGPLFCRSVDPVILAYYRKAYPPMFTLGPDATPQQVSAVVQHHPSTLPIECSAFMLARAINGWRFPYDPVQYCTA
jgi:outer membrane murein-binding lipoprotein Lpp